MRPSGRGTAPANGVLGCCMTSSIPPLLAISARANARRGQEASVSSRPSTRCSASRAASRRASRLNTSSRNSGVIASRMRHWPCTTTLARLTVSLSAVNASPYSLTMRSHSPLSMFIPSAFGFPLRCRADWQGPTEHAVDRRPHPWRFRRSDRVSEQTRDAAPAMSRDGGCGRECTDGG